VKNLVYQIKSNDLQDLQAGRRNAVATVTHNMLQNICKEVENHEDICCATGSTHIDI
jgi:hypothetical protein